MKQTIEPYLNNFITYLENNKDKNNLTDSQKIARYLDNLGNQNKYQVNFHWNPSGWFTLLGANSQDSNLHLNFGATYLVKPKLLEAFYFMRRPDLSFLRLEYQGLEPTGINNYDEKEIPRSEEYVLYQGKFHSRSCWDEGQTQDGLPMGLEAELQVRELKDGVFMIIPKGNILNTSDLNYHRNDIATFGRNSTVLQELISRFR